jgi:uncharacterized protein (DUF1697 family)
MTSYLALLRGVNVGGKNKVPMADLKRAFEGLGYSNVRTYIASGNVMCQSSKKAEQLTDEIERLLAGEFDLTVSRARVLVLTDEQMQQVVDQAPEGFGAEPGTYRYYVYFLMGIPPGEALAAFELKPEVDAVWTGARAIYSRQLLSRLTQSRINKIASSQVYKSMTIRNWNTTTTLCKLMSADRQPGGLEPNPQSRSPA